MVKAKKFKKKPTHFYNNSYSHPGKPVFEECMKEEKTKLQAILYNLTRLHISYTKKYYRGLSAILLCAPKKRKKTDAIVAAKLCVNRELKEFRKETSYVEKYLLSVWDECQLGLQLIRTCTNRARVNATLSVNDILLSLNGVYRDLVPRVSFHLNFKY